MLCTKKKQLFSLDEAPVSSSRLDAIMSKIIDRPCKPKTEKMVTSGTINTLQYYFYYRYKRYEPFFCKVWHQQLMKKLPHYVIPMNSQQILPELQLTFKKKFLLEAVREDHRNHPSPNFEELKNRFLFEFGNIRRDFFVSEPLPEKEIVKIEEVQFENAIENDVQIDLMVQRLKELEEPDPTSLGSAEETEEERKIREQENEERKLLEELEQAARDTSGLDGREETKMNIIEAWNIMALEIRPTLPELGKRASELRHMVSESLYLRDKVTTAAGRIREALAKNEALPCDEKIEEIKEKKRK